MKVGHAAIAVTLVTLLLVSCSKSPAIGLVPVLAAQTTSSTSSAGCSIQASNDDRHPGCLPSVLSAVNWNNAQRQADRGSAQILCDAACTASWVNRDASNNLQTGPDCIGDTNDTNSQKYLPINTTKTLPYNIIDYYGMGMKLDGAYGTNAPVTICNCGESPAHHYSRNPTYYNVSPKSSYSHCYNLQQDCGEAGIDCGSPSSNCEACNVSTLGQPCVVDADCRGGTYCGRTSKKCVSTLGIGQPCTVAAECNAGTTCSATSNTCVSFVGQPCTVNADCGGGTTICSTTSNTCVNPPTPCTSNEDCTTPGFPTCNPYIHQCVRS